MGNASHLLKCENTNKLKSVKGEKNCFIVSNDPVRLDDKCVYILINYIIYRIE